MRAADPEAGRMSMITLVFVHGTGVRKHGYDDTESIFTLVLTPIPN